MIFSNVCNDRLGVKKRLRSGFTLIEILSVIVIIGLLASIALVSLGGARSFFGGVTAKARLDDISQCVEMYQQKYGEYPPDLSVCEDNDESLVLEQKVAIRRHILKRWPQVLKSRTANVDEMVNDAYDAMQKGPGWPLLFWLAGFDGEGFSSDSKDPFSLGDNRETPMIELSLSSKDDADGNWNERLGLMYRGIPIAYFRAEDGGYGDKEFHIGANEDTEVAAPYMKNGVWYNPESFQLVWAGEDGLFGACEHEHHESEHNHNDAEEARDLGTKNNVSTADNDNVTNFTNGATIESELE